MIVEEFGLFSPDDPHDLAWNCDICWSRVYEYPYVAERVSGSIHNTSWGFAEIHRRFKGWLDANFDDVVHSDVRPSELARTAVWDVRTPPPNEWINRFDTVLSISTLEEVAKADHVDIMVNGMLPQVKPGGQLIVTFDLPGFQIEQVEDHFGVKAVRPDVLLVPANSVNPVPHWTGRRAFNCGYLVVRR